MQDENYTHTAELADHLHEELLADGKARFPEESYQQLRNAGASEEEALLMLGYGSDRQPLAYNDERPADPAL